MRSRVRVYFQTTGPKAFRDLVIGEKERKALLHFFYNPQVPGVWMALQIPTTEGHPDGGHGSGCFAFLSHSLPQDPLIPQLACIALLWCFTVGCKMAITWAWEGSEHNFYCNSLHYSGAKVSVPWRGTGTLCPESLESWGPGSQTNRLLWIWQSGGCVLHILVEFGIAGIGSVCISEAVVCYLSVCVKVSKEHKVAI